MRQPESHLAAAILVTLFCLPLGIVAIVKAAGVRSAWSVGDYDKACRDSVSAWQWITWAVWVTLIPAALVALVAAADFLMH